MDSFAHSDERDGLRSSVSSINDGGSSSTDDQEPNTPIPSQGLEQSALSGSIPSLPKVLRALFIINGLSTSLQTLPIMYILNTHVAVPVPYLPTYGAIAFLPWSLKPLYASIMALMPSVLSRARLVTILLSCNAVCIAGMAFLPKNGVVACFALAFAENIFAAWAEFCLGVTLIDRARNVSASINAALAEELPTLASSSFDVLVAKMQAQAATSRNIGALMANAMTITIFAHRYWMQLDASISYTVALELLLATAAVNFMGGAFAYFSANDFIGGPTHMLVPTTDVVEDLENPVESPIDKAVQYQKKQSKMCPQNQHRQKRTQTQTITEDDLCEAAVAAFESLRSYPESDDHSCPSYTSNADESDASGSTCEYVEMTQPERRNKSVLFSGGNIALVVILQVIVVVIALKQPIVAISSDIVWRTVVFTCVLAFVATALALYLQVPALSSQDWVAHRTGIFLMIRHAMPSDSIVVSSFFYSMLSSTPIVWQLVSLAGTATTTIGSWTYGKYLSHYSSGASLQWVIIGTTILSIGTAFGMVGLVRAVNQGDMSMTTWMLVAALVAHLFSTLAAEWAFLPDVIVATTASKSSSTDIHGGRIDTGRDSPINNCQEHDRCARRNEKKESDASAMKYGTMISCIDFGDQIGAMLGGPLAAVLQVSRERGWYHLDWLIAISAISNLLPLAFLWLLPNKRRQA